MFYIPSTFPLKYVRFDNCLIAIYKLVVTVAMKCQVSSLPSGVRHSEVFRHINYFLFKFNLIYI